MQKIKKMCHAVQKIFLKKSILGQNLTFWPLEGLGKSFPEDKIYIIWNALLLSNFMQKIEKFWCAVRKQSLKKSNLGPNLTFWPRPQGVKSFFRKLENVTFLLLCCSNFVQNIKNIWCGSWWDSLKSGPGTWDPRPETRDPGTWDPGPKTLNLRPKTRDPGTWDPGPKTRDPGPAILRTRILRPRPIDS